MDETIKPLVDMLKVCDQSAPGQQGNSEQQCKHPLIGAAEDIHFMQFLDESIQEKGLLESHTVSKELVDDLISAIRKHGVGFYDWQQTLAHLVTAMQCVVSYNVMECYQAQVLDLVARDLVNSFASTQQQLGTSILGTT